MGFGGNGNASDKFGFRGFCVTDGPFAYLNVSFIGVMEKPHCLSRGFLAGDALASWSQRIRPTAIATLFESQDYVNFSLAIERGPHPTIPHVVHGDFSVPTALQGRVAQTLQLKMDTNCDAVTDPVWYLVHGEYDKLWWEWQEVNRKRLEDYGGRFMDGAVEKTASLDDQLQFGGLSPDVKVLKVINTTAWPLCYKY